MHIHHKVKTEHMNLKGMIIEVATIIFAVLLALGAESWWEHYKTMETVEISTERINKEIAGNLYGFTEILRNSSIKYNKLLALEKEINNTASFYDLAKKFGGYDYVHTNNSTWKRVLNDKAATYFPVDYMEEAYKIYNYIEDLSFDKESLYKFLYSDLFFNKEKQKIAYEISKLYFKELLRHYNELIEKHETFLKKYDAENYKQIIAKCDSIKTETE